MCLCVYVQKDGREKKQKDIKRKEKQKQAYYIVLTMSDSLFREATVLQTRVPNSTQLHTHTYKTSLTLSSPAHWSLLQNPVTNCTDARPESTLLLSCPRMCSVSVDTARWEGATTSHPPPPPPPSQRCTYQRRYLKTRGTIGGKGEKRVFLVPVDCTVLT